ncbi:restriction endonuclease subunit S [Deinococcus sp. Arct2-2]|uniref:restriction endonuclease subunit S n=1 Tax=Deinococcus sp. Arct2-2 TaxID=2568653 RepID=UPI0010A39D00|nr:restriction endonuclease subunit S [Deinococcus sp. Arct2-2]THF70968.1 restriction endonuclease subunit S [Deinococcus sp. Arct2-2]
MSAVPPRYKQTEVGVMPEDWDITEVGQEFEVQLGKMLDSAKNFGTPKPYIGNRHVQWRKIESDDLPHIAISKNEMARYQLKKGDLLVCEGGEVGRAALWEGQIDECYYQKALHRLRPKNDYSSVLMLEFFSYWAMTGAFSNYVTQTSIAHLPAEKLRLLPLPKIPVPEQRAIASALADVEALLSSQEELLTKKRQLKQAAMQELLSGKKRLEGFMGEWEEKTLGEIAEIVMGQAPSSKNYYLQPVGLPLLQGNADIRARRSIERIWTTQVTKKAFKSDILMTVRAPVGSIGIASNDAVLGRGICAIRSISIFMEFLYHKLLSVEKEWESASQGSTFNAVNSDQIKSFVIFIPTGFSEQQAIAAVLSDMDVEIDALAERLTKTRGLKQGMMQELLTGRTRLV